MKIETNEEPLNWRNTDYRIDHDNGLAITPYQLKQAKLSYRNLVRRKIIRPELAKAKSPDVSSNRRNFMRSFISPWKKGG
jgi:hypothetical protein